jgi:hypothetical protein
MFPFLWLASGDTRPVQFEGWPQLWASILIVLALAGGMILADWLLT